MATAELRRGLFAAVGIEMEYMIVDATTLDVRPIADRLLASENDGRIDNSVTVGDLAWSNELVQHVVEFKNPAPEPDLAALPERFRAAVRRAHERLEPLNARLMPTAMHPWMDPHRETVLWSHDDREIYETFNRIFDCRGHGWSNLQSMHVNLPFDGDREFGRLHDAIRLLLPVLPALVASSPIEEGEIAPQLCRRMHHYARNSAKIPAVAGLIVPEAAASERDYERSVYQPIAQALQPLDPAGILEPVWVNARGAIARFDRGSIEIRVLDLQEHPLADCAVAAFIVAILRGLVEERWCGHAEQHPWPSTALRRVMDQAVTDADQAEVRDVAYLNCLAWDRDREATLDEVLRNLYERCIEEGLLDEERWGEPLELIFDEGPLARRIVDWVGSRVTRTRIADCYRLLCDCLRDGRGFRVGDA